MNNHTENHISPDSLDDRMLDQCLQKMYQADLDGDDFADQLEKKLAEISEEESFEECDDNSSASPKSDYSGDSHLWSMAI